MLSRSKVEVPLPTSTTTLFIWTWTNVHCKLSQLSLTGQRSFTSGSEIRVTTLFIIITVRNQSYFRFFFQTSEFSNSTVIFILIFESTSQLRSVRTNRTDTESTAERGQTKTESVCKRSLVQKGRGETKLCRGMVSVWFNHVTKTLAPLSFTPLKKWSFSVVSAQREGRAVSCLRNELPPHTQSREEEKSREKQKDPFRARNNFPGRRRDWRACECPRAQLQGLPQKVGDPAERKTRRTRGLHLRHLWP